MEGESLDEKNAFDTSMGKWVDILMQNRGHRLGDRANKEGECSVGLGDAC